jgi:pyruvate/2-oxoglutarate dehydrogenase complex dihydrolipoamide dehydrogenase (E3) component
VEGRTPFRVWPQQGVSIIGPNGAVKTTLINLATGAFPLTRGTIWLKDSVGKRVVIAGGGLVGVEMSDFLAEKKLAETITVIEMLPSLAYDMPAMARTYMLQVLLPRWGVRTVINMHIQEITENGVCAIDNDWKRHTFDCDTVITTLGYVPNNALGEAFDGTVPELYTVGDCVKPGNLLTAVHDAAYIARQI